MEHLKKQKLQYRTCYLVEQDHTVPPLSSCSSKAAPVRCAMQSAGHQSALILRLQQEDLSGFICHCNRTRSFPEMPLLLLKGRTLACNGRRIAVPAIYSSVSCRFYNVFR